MGLFFKWKIENVIILPFGGITIFNEKVDMPLIEEFLIAIAGPLFQIIFYMCFRTNILFNNYNIAVLCFNLLPIFPLDGSKMINILLNKLFPFKMSHKISLILSIVFVIFAFFYLKYSIFFVFALLLILLEVFKEISKHSYYFNKFLLERYLYPHHFKHVKYITKITHMKRQTSHIFKVDNDYYLESEIMRKTFDK